MNAPRLTRSDHNPRELIYSEKIIAERIRLGFIVAGKAPENVSIEQRHDHEGKYWVVIVR